MLDSSGSDLSLLSAVQVQPPSHGAYSSLIKKHLFKQRAVRVAVATPSQRCYFSAACNFDIKVESYQG